MCAPVQWFERHRPPGKLIGEVPIGRLSLDNYAEQLTAGNAHICRRERSEFAALLFGDGSGKPPWSLAGYAAGATFTSKARVSASVS